MRTSLSPSSFALSNPLAPCPAIISLLPVCVLTFTLALPYRNCQLIKAPLPAAFGGTTRPTFGAPAQGITKLAHKQTAHRGDAAGRAERRNMRLDDEEEAMTRPAQGGTEFVTGMGLVRIHSCMNHSCAPNANMTFSEHEDRGHACKCLPALLATNTVTDLI